MAVDSSLNFPMLAGSALAGPALAGSVLAGLELSDLPDIGSDHRIQVEILADKADHSTGFLVHHNST